LQPRGQLKDPSWSRRRKNCDNILTVVYIGVKPLYLKAFIAAALLAQEPAAPTFDSNTKLVLVPFHVERGKYFAADMQSSDFILREDGHPRPFMVFEGPNTEYPLPLELILLFDATPKSYGA
jgi:hypothetical protein